ncbi:nucleosome assembly protein [Salix suchowensis]|nr:nucleosome assembly protein [Salix suchowensis]
MNDHLQAIDQHSLSFEFASDSDKQTLFKSVNYNMNVSLSPKVSKRVECLRHLQSQHDELEAQFLEERKALEAKYQKLFQPLYTKRCEIVNGLREVDGVMSAELYSIEEDQATKEKGVPEFWLTAMKTQEVLAEEIKGQDEGALKFIKDIKWSRLQSPEGFKLEFYFNPCPYFKNSVLTKTYHIIDESDHILSQAIGTEIEWYPGKCLTKKVVKKKPRMGSKKTKTITTLKICESFFTFFNPPHIPESVDDLDDDAYDELQDRIEHDYDVGIIIRDKIIRHAVSWFTGEAIEDDELDGINYDDNDDDDDDKEDEKNIDAYDSDDDDDKEDEKNIDADDNDDDDDNDKEDQKSINADDNESNKEAEQEKKRKQGVEKDNSEHHEEDRERKQCLKKDEKNNDADDNNDKEVEQEEKRKEGVKKDINKDHDDSYDEERNWILKKDVNDDDDEKKNDSIDNDNGFWVRYQPLRFRL